MATELPSLVPCYDADVQPKTGMGPLLNNTSMYLGNDEEIFPEPRRAHENSPKECMGLLTDLKKKIQQTELHLRHSVQLEVPVHSFLLNITYTINSGTKMLQHDQKRKTLQQGCRRHLCVPSPSNRRRSIATHR